MRPAPSLLCAAACAALCACGMPKVKLSASGLNPGASGAAQQPLLGDGPGEYEGIGRRYSEAVVDGLRIWLTEIRLGSGRKGAGNERVAFDWRAAPRELEVKDGFSGRLEDVAEIAPGTYDFLELSMATRHAVKAYAYFDSDGDGAVDRTLYTTAAGFAALPNKTLPADLPGYDYFLQNRTYPDATGPESWGGFTIPPQPFVVAETDETLNLELRIDSFRGVKAWSGHVDGWTDYSAPPTATADLPGLPFDSRHIGPGKFFEPGTPAFGLMPLPAFVFGSTSANASVRGQTLLLSETGTFGVRETTVLTLVFDASGAPLIGFLGPQPPPPAVSLGFVVRACAPLPAGHYRCHAGNGSEGLGDTDGGIFYSNDPAKATHLLDGMRALAAVGDTAVLTAANGPRCGQPFNPHNLCIPDAAGAATPGNGATRTLHVKRVR